VETDVRKLGIIVVAIIVAGLFAYFALDFILPPEDATAAQGATSSSEPDPAAAQSLGYLTHKSDVAKVVVKGVEVFIGFNDRPKDQDLTAIVNEAALKYADTTGREVDVHGTHMQQIASIGTPSFLEYCNTRAGVTMVLGDDGKTVNKPVIIESNCAIVN
jgi:hypothetical protein